MSESTWPKADRRAQQRTRSSMALQAARGLCAAVYTPVAITEDQVDTWAATYRGVFLALGVTNVAMARELAERTRSDREVVEAVDIMRAAPPGDRVWPALHWLRVRRCSE